MIDLDAARAARREAEQKGPVVKLDGQEFELAVEMPFGVLEAFRSMADPAAAAGAMAQLGKALLGEHYSTIVGLGLSVDDLNVLLDGVMKEYGVNHPLPSATP